MSVVLFTGGRGSAVLSRQLVTDPRVRLTLAINGYDDGASTGEVRRALGDCLGPSDFRKNASRLALELGTCAPALVALLDARLPADADRTTALEEVTRRAGAFPAVADRISRFAAELDASGQGFNFADCSIGNLAFAGGFIEVGRDFNRAVDDYCSLVGLCPGLIENVTGGENAHLVAVRADGGVLGSEEEIVSVAGHHAIRELYLLDRQLTPAERGAVQAADDGQRAAFFAQRRRCVTLNPRLAQRLAEASLIIYAPGTQHSSLFPSYMTPGLGNVIASNLTATKLLITNLHADTEIVGASATDLIDRALFYLNEKHARRFPRPCLITHVLVNDADAERSASAYVPPGRIDTLDDPRLVRVANYEDGVTGRHDAPKVLTPVVTSLAERRERRKLAVLVHGASSADKVTQTLLEMIRGGMTSVPVDATVFYEGPPLDPAFLDLLPFTVVGVTPGSALEELLSEGRFDYVLLFESSGMYRGDAIAALAGSAAASDLDAVWGSRRLYPRDVEESIRFRYRKSPMMGIISKIGSHVLSVACLVVYGRYVSDTLSRVFAVRVKVAPSLDVPLTHPRAPQLLLSSLLREKAALVEVPIQFYPLSPERAKRTTVVEGLQAFWTLVRGRAARSSASASWRPKHVEDTNA